MMVNFSRIMFIAALVLCGVAGRIGSSPVEKSSVDAEQASLHSSTASTSTLDSLGKPIEVELSFADRFSRLRKGMSRNVAKNLLGYPEEVANDDHWIYRRNAKDGGKTELFSVHFTQNLVSGFSRMTFRRPDRDDR